MPLIGVIDPSHDELKANEPGRRPNWLTPDELLAVAQEKGPKWSPWTYELLAATMGEHQERDYISSSLLCSPCPRSAVLERTEDYIEDVDRFWRALRGTMIHRTLESAVREGGLAEWRFWTTMDTKYGKIELSCSPDLVTVGPEATLWDYKTTENPPSFGYPYRDHTLQVQFNRFIVNHAERWETPDGWQEIGAESPLQVHPSEIDFQHVVVVYLGPNGPKPIEVEKTRMVTLPSTQRQAKRKMPYVWDDDSVLSEEEGDLMARVEAMQLALDSYPAWPKGLEDAPGWGGPPGWKCPGYPVCRLPRDLAKRYPDSLVWDKPTNPW